MIEPLGRRPIFSVARRVRAADAIVAQFREAIASGKLAAGDRLPSHREMADQFGVSRNAVLQAMQVLERVGLITIKPGARGGAFVRQLDARQFTEHLELMIAVEQVSVGELSEFRQLVEGQNAFWAAQRRTVDQLAEIEAIVERYGELSEDSSEEAWSALLAQDALLHAAIARAANNRAADAVMHGVMGALHKELQRVPSWTRGKALKDARGIYGAIKVRNGELARERMTNHIREFFAITHKTSDT